MIRINKIKIKYLYFIVLLGNLSNAQDTKLPNLVLPSPQASEISTFGNVPVDESNGRVSPSIPLYTYTVGKLQVPLTLNYAGNTVKVEQKPTWTGINWVLNAGGIITRTVRDLPDETNKPRYFFSEYELQQMQTFYENYGNLNPPNLLNNGLTIPFALQNQIATEPEFADTEVDEFNFSFAGYSGSFFLKKNAGNVFEAKQIKYENELKIEIIGNFNLTTNFTFKITTPDGTSYFFGEQVDFPGSTELPSFAVEETQFVDRSSGFPKYGIRAKTAFYLTRIENYLGDKIFLEYFTKDEHEVFSAANMEISIPIFQTVDVGCALPSSINFNQNIVKNVIYNAKFLKKIWSSQTGQRIVFNSFEAKNRTSIRFSPYMKFRVLSNIDCGFGHGIIDFEYNPSKSTLQNNLSSTEKFFLTNVIFKNSDSTKKNEEYKMEYNDPLSLPATTFSNAQDYLGFFNGKYNASLLPKNSMKYSADYFNEIGISNFPYINFANFSSYDSNLGDREPSFEYASKGVLQKITYPTGGSTQFEYEPIVKDRYLYAQRALSIYKNNSSRIPVSKPTDNTVIAYDPFQGPNGESNLPDPSIVYVSQTVNINLEIKIHNRAGVNVRDRIYIKLTDPVNNRVEEKFWAFPNQQPYDNQEDFTATIPFNLAAGGSYVFEMGFRSNAGGLLPGSNAFVEANAGFSFISGLDENDGAGIRIKRVKDYESNNANPTNIRRYYYKSLKEAILKKNSYDQLTFKPFFHKILRSDCTFQDFNGNTRFNEGLVVSLHTNSFAQNLEVSKVLTTFPNVTISLGGDNFENGGIEKTFMVKTNVRQTPFRPTTENGNNLLDIESRALTINDNYMSNFSEFNGKLLKETFWIKSNTLSKQREKRYEYVILENRDVVHNINGVKSYIEQASLTATNLFFGLYDTNSKKINNTKETVIDFVDEVPITKYTVPPFQLFNGWQFQDHDSDGILNPADEHFITPEEFALLTDEEIEAPFKKIITTEEVNYYHDVAGLPSTIKTSISNNTIKEVKNFYPITSNIDQVTGLNYNDIVALNILKNQNRVNNPFQVENYSNSEKLATKRIIYSPNELLNSTFEYKIQTAKGTNPLEDRIIYHNYDTKGNPTELSLKGGTRVVYIWSNQRKPIYKIENATYQQVMTAISSGVGLNPIDYDVNSPQPQIVTNPFIVSLPNAQVTIFNYDPITQLLKSVIDPKGFLITYEYDDFNRLKKIKDKDGNTLSDNEYNYRPN